MLFLASGCGGAQRSVAKYCSTYFSEKKAYIEKYNGAADAISKSKDPLAGALLGAGMTAAAIGDIEVMFDKLSRVSPDEITPDLEAIHDSVKRQLDAVGGAASNPLGALAASLVSGFASSGSWQKVGDWTIAHCGSA